MRAGFCCIRMLSSLNVREGYVTCGCGDVEHLLATAAQLNGGMISAVITIVIERWATAETPRYAF